MGHAQKMIVTLIIIGHHTVALKHKTTDIPLESSSKIKTEKSSTFNKIKKGILNDWKSSFFLQFLITFFC